MQMLATAATDWQWCGVILFVGAITACAEWFLGGIEDGTRCPACGAAYINNDFRNCPNCGATHHTRGAH